MSFKNFGIRNVTINLYHHGEVLKKLIAPCKKLGLKISWSKERKILGTGGGIAQALRKMKPESTFILNGDIITDINLKEMHHRHQNHQAQATLACLNSKRMKVKNFVEFNRDQKIIRLAGIPKKITQKNKLSRGIFSGVHLIEPKIFRGYPKNQFGCVVRQVYQTMIENKKELSVYQHPGHWWDLGSLEALKKLDSQLWNQQAPQSIQKLWHQANTL